MEKTEYIDFDIRDEAKVIDFLVVYQLICEEKRKWLDENSSQTDAYWLKAFPDYALKHYMFSDQDLRPDFSMDQKREGAWHFYSMIAHLVEDLDVQLSECGRTDDGTGRLNFYANAYPYGGITGMAMFLRSFDLVATKIDEGGGVYLVNWLTESEFHLTDTTQRG